MTEQASRKRDILTSVALLFGTLALSLGYSRGRIMWSDELFGWMLVTDPSFRHMLFAWNAGADGGGICFYLLARGWLDVFGRTVTAFRLFSAAGVGLSAAFSFGAARRFFPWSVAAGCVSLLWFTSDIVLWQVMQGRFYGLLLAGVAVAAYLAMLTAEAVTAKRLLLTFLCHTLLAGTHPFGVIYSGVIVGAMVLSDGMAHRLRPRVYLAAISGWWILLPSIEALRNTAAVGRPRFWTVTPRLADLGAAFSCWSLPAAVVLGGAAALCAALLLLRVIRLRDVRRSLHLNRPLLLLGGALVGVPLVAFLVSQRGTSIFVDRYLIAVVIGMSFLLCQLISWISTALGEYRSLRFAQRLVPVVLGVVLVLVAAVQFPSHWSLPARDQNVELVRMLPAGVPIVVEAPDLFDQILAYHREPGHDFRFLLDWENANAPGSLPGEVSGYHEMENWRKVGYFSGSIDDARPFLEGTPAFAVIHSPQLLFFERRILRDPAFEIQELAKGGRDPSSAEPLTVWMVRRRPLPRGPE